MAEFLKSIPQWVYQIAFGIVLCFFGYIFLKNNKDTETNNPHEPRKYISSFFDLILPYFNLDISSFLTKRSKYVALIFFVLGLSIIMNSLMKI